MCRKMAAALLIGAILVGGCQGTPSTSTITPTPERHLSSPSPTPVEQAETAKNPPKDAVEEKAWTEFTADDGSFSVLLPGKAEIDQSSQETEEGEVHYGSLLTKVGDDLYSLEYVDFPNTEMAQKSHEERLANARDSGSGRLVSEETVTLDGREGVLFELATADGDTFYDAIFLVDTRVYDILIEHNQDPEADSSLADRVRESFRFN